MVSFTSYSSQVSAILVVLLFTPSLARVSVKVTKNVIGDICSKTQDPSFCLGVLNSNLEANSADLQGLAKNTIDLARSNSAKTLQLIHSLIPKTADAKLKESYTTCSKHYDDAIGSLGDAQKDLITGDPNGVNLSASAFMDEAGNCEEALKGLATDPSILKGVQDVNKIVSIILVISNLLPR